MRTAKEKILFVIQTTGFGGLEIIVLDWLRHIDYSTASVVLIYRDSSIELRVRQLGLPVECIQSTETTNLSFWKLFKTWISYLVSIRPSRIVLFEGSVADFSLAIILACSCAVRRKLFLYESLAPRQVKKAKRRLHFGFLPGLGLHYYWHVWKVRLRTKLGAQTLVMSKGVQDKLSAYYKYSSERVSILYHGVDTQHFRPATSVGIDYRRSNGIPYEAVVIVSHGRLAKVKRVDRILKAFEQLALKDSRIWLLLTAYGPLTDEVQNAVTMSPFRSRIKLSSFQNDMSTLLQASNIYVLASENEGFCIALVEAMATGLICVATNVSGPSEIVVNGENGFLVDPTDDGVLQGLQRALNLNNAEQSVMSQKARDTAVEKFDIRRSVTDALAAIAVPQRFNGPYSISSEENDAINSMQMGSSHCKRFA
jgi:glycosyltransferase involved in cell wall biosynthesis